MDETSKPPRSPTDALRILSVVVAILGLGLWSGSSTPAIGLETPLNLAEAEVHAAVDGATVRPRATQSARRLRTGRRFAGSVSVLLVRALAASRRAWAAADQPVWAPCDGWGNPAVTRGPPFALD